MRYILPLFLLLAVWCSSCEEEKSLHNLQYEVRVKSGNQARFSVHYLAPNSATVSTGIIDTTFWQSGIYTEVKEDTEVAIEVKVEGKPSMDLIIRKDGSVFSTHEIRSILDPLEDRSKL